MAETMESPDRVTFDHLHSFLLEQFGSREEFQQIYDDIIAAFDDYIDLVLSRTEYHLQVLEDRSIEMAVRDTLCGSQFAMPAAIIQNHQDWLAYIADVHPALVIAKRHAECGALLRDEFVNIACVWDTFWDSEEEGRAYNPGDGQLLLNIVRDIQYYENRREFLDGRFEAVKEQIVILFDQEPIWLGFI